VALYEMLEEDNLLYRIYSTRRLGETAQRKVCRSSRRSAPTPCYVGTGGRLPAPVERAAAGVVAVRRALLHSGLRSWGRGT